MPAGTGIYASYGVRACFRKSLFIKASTCARFSLQFLLHFSAIQRNPWLHLLFATPGTAVKTQLSQVTSTDFPSVSPSWLQSSQTLMRQFMTKKSSGTAASVLLLQCDRKIRKSSIQSTVEGNKAWWHFATLACQEPPTWSWTTLQYKQHFLCKHGGKDRKKHLKTWG